MIDKPEAPFVNATIAVRSRVEPTVNALNSVLSHPMKESADLRLNAPAESPNNAGARDLDLRLQRHTAGVFDLDVRLQP
jgi:hypothetical protein